MKANKSNKKSEWQEVDAEAIIRTNAEIILKTLYESTTKTASQLAKETGMDLSSVHEALDDAIKQGVIQCLKSPYQREPVYARVAKKGIADLPDLKPAILMAARVVWHCLGKSGRLTEDEIRQETGLEIYYVNMGIGYLSGDGKLRMFQNNRTDQEAFCLTESQLKIYRQEFKWTPARGD